MSFSLSYAEWFDVVHVTVAHWRPVVEFRDGAERAAVLAAMEQQKHGCGREVCIAAIIAALEAYEVVHSIH